MRNADIMAAFARRKLTSEQAARLLLEADARSDRRWRVAGVVLDVLLGIALAACCVHDCSHPAHAGEQSQSTCVRQCLSSRPRTRAWLAACRDSCRPRPVAPQSVGPGA